MPSPPRPPSPHEQRRQFARVPVRMSAEVHIGDTTFTATTRDLSQGGCGLEAAQPLPEGVELTLGLFLVVDEVEEAAVPPLWVKGRVAWSGELDSGGTIAGIRFEVITEAQKAWIGQVLGHLTPRPA